MWPWSFNKCSGASDVGYTGWSQKITACNDFGEGMHAFQGRGAPEIDVMEAQISCLDNCPAVATTSLQIAPRLPQKLRPQTGRRPNSTQWYQGLSFGNSSTINQWYYGSGWNDCVSALTSLDATHYDHFHKYRLEWQLESENGRDDGYFRWYYDDVAVFSIPASAFQQSASNSSSRNSYRNRSSDKHVGRMPTEPMSIVINTAVATSFSTPCTLWSNDSRCKQIFSGEGARFEVDYVRVYQRRGGTPDTIGCSPKAYPTKEWIEANAAWYGAEVPSHRHTWLRVLVPAIVIIALAAVLLSLRVRLGRTNFIARCIHIFTCGWIRMGIIGSSAPKAPAEKPLLDRLRPPSSYGEFHQIDRDRALPNRAVAS
jgi:hypothetical protein